MYVWGGWLVRMGFLFFNFKEEYSYIVSFLILCYFWDVYGIVEIGGLVLEKVSVLLEVSFLSFWVNYFIFDF